LTGEEKLALLHLARHAITEATLHERIPDLPVATGGLAQKCGVFVSLHIYGRLRGCIGQLDGLPNLADGVARCAIAAAQDDPRFSPVRAEEIQQLEIEISVLSRPEPIAPGDIIPGHHGLLLTQGPFRGLLLPQVATQFHWSRERFLEETCVKAGLPPNAWQDPETRILAFTANVFSESEFLPQRRSRAS
jgi:AmmeMemoRadiSam system protein A